MLIDAIHLFKSQQIFNYDQLVEYTKQILNDYESLGPLPGILLPFIEAFLPFLPLLVFILTNAAAYGLLKGFLYSWIGTCLGCIAVFLIIRKLGNKRIFKAIRKNKQVSKVTGWVDRHGFSPLFLLQCFPFSLSSVINVVSGLSNVSIQQYVLSVLLGKSVMIFSVSYIGTSIFEFAESPVRTIIVSIGIVLFWFVGKFIEKRLQKNTMIREQREELSEKE